MTHLHIDIRGKAASGKTTVAHKIRDMLALDEMFKDREVFIIYEEEASDAVIKNLEMAHPDGIFIYDGGR